MTQAIPKTPYLGPRLRALFERVELAQNSDSPYHSIWDCCCDHGYLGIKLLHKHLCQHLHFNDLVPHLIEDVQRRLQEYPDDFFRTQITAAAGDAGALKLNPDHRHLVIIAGVGGEQMANILASLLPQHPTQTIDFLFCPATTQFDLRSALNASSFELLHESLISERNRDYEVIHARWNGDANAKIVSLTGELWQADNPIHRRHLIKLMKHYQRRTQGDGQKEAQRVLGIYQAYWQTLTGETYDFG